MEKAKGLYEVLQEGGFERHTHISAGDKDFKPVFEKLCAFSTYDIFELTSPDVKNLYSDDDGKDIRDCIDDEAEEGFLEIVYGPAST